MERLAKHLVDIAIRGHTMPNPRAIHLLDERWMVLVHPAHRLAVPAKRFVTWEELSQEDLMVPTQRIEEIAGWFAEKGLPFQIDWPLATAVAWLNTTSVPPDLSQPCASPIEDSPSAAQHIRIEEIVCGPASPSPVPSPDGIDGRGPNNLTAIRLSAMHCGCPQSPSKTVPRPASPFSGIARQN